MHNLKLITKTMSELTEKEFWSALKSIPTPAPVFYRLYYNDDGTPIIYSMEKLPGNYIEVDQQTYVLSAFNVRVVDGKLVYIKPIITVKKLQPNTVTGIACAPHDVCVIVGSDQPHIKWTIVHNELN
jgi:hypothetical protein